MVDAPDGTIVALGPRGFATLALFARPRALGDAIERLEADESSSTDFVPTLSVINMLIEDGAVCRRTRTGGPMRGWVDPVDRARMLHDDRRTGDYLSDANKGRLTTETGSLPTLPGRGIRAQGRQVRCGELRNQTAGFRRCGAPVAGESVGLTRRTYSCCGLVLWLWCVSRRRWTG